MKLSRTLRDVASNVTGVGRSRELLKKLANDKVLLATITPGHAKCTASDGKKYRFHESNRVIRRKIADALRGQDVRVPTVQPSPAQIAARLDDIERKLDAMIDLWS